MNLLETLPIAWKAIWLNKLRAFLTVLGIVIGVGAVVAMVAIGQGAKARVEASFASMGTNMLVVQSGSSNAGGSRGGFGSQPTLTWDDLKAIQTQAPAVAAATVSLRTSAQLQAQDQNWATSVYGTGPEFFQIRSWPAAAGSVLTTSDVQGDTKIVVLGQTVVDNLFGPNVNPVGQQVRIKNIPFEVVGVLSRKGQSAVGQDYDDAAYVPYTTYESKLQGGLQQFVAGQIMVAATSGDDTARAMSQITGLLRDRHHLRTNADDDFSIRNLADLASASAAGTETLSLLLASIAAVSLLVGGIGIMNIMLVSVTERTREIGLRMAIGAKPHQILAQFMVEAIVLSVAGGLIGILAGASVAWYLAVRLGWPIALQPQVMAIAVIFSGLVGVGFGLYPARKASLLDPIEALRFE